MRQAGLLFSSNTAPGGGPLVRDLAACHALQLSARLLEWTSHRRQQSAGAAAAATKGFESTATVIGRAIAALPHVSFEDPRHHQQLGAPCVEFWRRAQALCDDKILGMLARPTAASSNGLDLKKHPELSLAASAFEATWRLSSPEHVRAAPGCDDFPGAAIRPGLGASGTAHAAPSTITVTAQAHEWVCLGWWLSAGTVLKVQWTPADSAAADQEHSRSSTKTQLKLRVGCHADRLWHLDKWKRWPCISHTFDLPLAGQETFVSHPWGGLLYAENCSDQIQSATLLLLGEGLCAAPVFDLEKPEDWQSVRSHSARVPWTELRGQHIVLTIPSTSLGLVADPAALMRYWDAVVTHHCSLTGEPVPRRRERVVFDRQISAGYMHSGKGGFGKR